MALPKPVLLYCAGAFNPITYKHLRIMELARDALHRTGRYNVIKGIFSPAHEKYAKNGLAPAIHRLEMTKLAVETSSWLCVDSWEINQAEWPPTAIALRALTERLSAGTAAKCMHDGNCKLEPEGSPQAKRKRKSTGNDGSYLSGALSEYSTAQIMLVCGSDLIRSFSVPNLWAPEHMEEIVRDYGIVVVEREGSDPYKDVYSSDLLTKYTKNIHIVTDWLGDDFSSTKIRTSIRRNESIKYAVPDSVLNYILKHKLYNESYQPGYPYPSNTYS